MALKDRVYFAIILFLGFVGVLIVLGFLASANI